MTESTDIAPVGVEIKCSLPFALFADGEYKARLPAGNASVSLKRIRQKHFDPRLGIESGNFDVRWDRCGFVSYSGVSIKVDWPTFRSIRGNVGGRTEDEVLRRVAQTVINHVIDAYRKVTQEPWVRRVTEWDIFELEGELTRSDGVVECVKTMTAPGYGITLPVEGLSQEALQRFSTILGSTEPLSLWDNLWLESEDAFQRGDYTSSVIWGHSALETLSHATVLAWLAEQNVSIEKAANIVARNPSHAGKLKQCLSLEELIESLNDTHKVEIALLSAINVDPSWGFDFCSRFERLAALRNEVLHLGVAVTPRAAKDHLEIVRTIRAQLIHESNIERIQRHKASSVKAILSSLLGKEPHPKLAGLLDELEAQGKQVTVCSMPRYPIWLHKQSSLVAVVDGKTSMRIYLPVRSQISKTRCEIELTRLLLRRRMVIEEDWPEADIRERDANGNLSLGPFNWEGYRVVAVTITETILDFEINERLLKNGFNTQLQINSQLSNLEKSIEENDFKAPQWGELEYFLLPVKSFRLHALAPDDSKRLLQVLHDRAPEQSQKESRIFDAVNKVGWNTPKAAATAMLAVKDVLGLLDTIGVREAPRRILRTRLTNDELSTLGWKQQR